MFWMYIVMGNSEVDSAVEAALSSVITNATCFIDKAICPRCSKLLSQYRSLLPDLILHQATAADCNVHPVSWKPC